MELFESFIPFLSTQAVFFQSCSYFTKQSFFTQTVFYSLTHQFMKKWNGFFTYAVINANK